MSLELFPFSFQVFVTLKGTRGKITRTRLTKKAGSVRSNKHVAFKFSKGATHMFKIRGPELGDIKSMIMEVSSKSEDLNWEISSL